MQIKYDRNEINENLKIIVYKRVNKIYEIQTLKDKRLKIKLRKKAK